SYGGSKLRTRLQDFAAHRVNRRYATRFFQQTVSHRTLLVDHYDELRFAALVLLGCLSGIVVARKDLDHRDDGTGRRSDGSVFHVPELAKIQTAFLQRLHHALKLGQGKLSVESRAAVYTLAVDNQFGRL